MYRVSFEYVERLLSYEVMLKFWDDADDAENDDDKGITITRFLFFEKNRGVQY